MSPDLDSVLDECLTQILSGNATVAACLAAHPDLADDLGPLLRGAHWLANASWPSISSAARNRVRQQVLRSSTGRFEVVPSGPRRLVPQRVWRWALLAAAIMIAVAVLVVLARASGYSWPDSPPPSMLGRHDPTATQPVLVTPPAPSIDVQAPARQMDELSRHMAHVRTLATSGQVDLEEIALMTTETEAVLEAIPSLPPGDAWPLLQDLLALLADEERTLSGLVVKVTGPSRTGVQLALNGVHKQTARAEALAAACQPDRKDLLPSIESTPSPTATATARGATETNPPAPQPLDEIKTPERPGQHKSPAPPGQTKTPNPPGQTKKPDPPGQDNIPEPPGQDKKPDPPGKDKTPNPLGNDKASAPGQDKTPDPPAKDKASRPTGRP